MSAITTDQTPARGGTLRDAIAEGEAEGLGSIASGTVEPGADEEKKPARETTYTVLMGDSKHGPFSVVGEYTVVGGQKAARRAALMDNEGLKEALFNGGQFFLAAIANWAPVAPGVKNREPSIEA